jgi:glutaryl-CoA dehydrogenase
MSTEKAVSNAEFHKANKPDLYAHPDYYLMDELLTEEHKLVRSMVRDYVKKELSPIIEDMAQQAKFNYDMVKQLGDLGCFGPQ